MKEQNKYFLGGFLLLLLYFLPNLIMGDGSVIKVHDFLDSSVAHIKSIILNDAIWDIKAQMPILCGIDRGVFGTPIDIKFWLFCLLSPYWAVIANIVLIKLTAFVGMYLLLTRHIFPPNGPEAVRAAFLAALCFALVPFYPDYGITSAGIPLLICAFINLYNKRRLLGSALILLYYAVFSWLVLGGFFVCATVFVAIICISVRTRHFPLSLFWGLCAFGLLLIICNYNLFISFFTQAEPSHRTEFAIIGPLWLNILSSLSSFFISWYHAGSCLAILVVIPFVILWLRKRGEKPYLNLPFSLFLLVGGLMLVGSLMLSLTLRFHLFQGFQTDRFFFLYPAVVFILLGVLLLEWGKSKTSTWILIIMMVFNLGADFHWRDNMANMLGVTKDVSFAQFYDEPLFDSIKKDVGIGHDVKVACLGFFPAVAEYNGIYTVDGYIQLYPLSYKHRFQQVIQGELDKSEELREYFCNYGQRCYLFSSELGRHYLYGKDQHKKVHDLSINCKVLKEDLGCSYILSAVEVENAEALGLQYMGDWTTEQSYWDIYVYQL